MATFQVAPPERFNFSTPEEWTKWIRCFERFRQASGLSTPENQVNTLIYTMGDEGDDILSPFGLGEDDKKKYDTVKEKFQGYFIKKHNVIFERAKFNMRSQLEGESVDSFVTALHGLAEHCNFRDLKEELIRDRMVVGLRDATLSEKLQMDPDLTLEKAVTSARQRESVRKQQPLLRGDPAESSLPKEDPLPNVDTVVKKLQCYTSQHFLKTKGNLLLHNATGVVDPSTEDTNAQLSMLFVVSANAEVTSRKSADPPSECKKCWRRVTLNRKHQEHPSWEQYRREGLKATNPGA